MKRKLLLAAMTFLMVVACAVGFTACGDNGGTGVDGTYYLYVNDTLDKTQFITLNDKTWTDDEGETGEYSLSGSSITLYAELLGEQEEFASGTVKDGVLTLDIMGVHIVYCKEGVTPPSDSGETPQEKYTVTYDANGGVFGNDKTTFAQNDIPAGSLLTAPTSPTRDGYSFAGWAKKKNGSELWMFDTDKVSGNTTLYAVWTQKSGIIVSVDGASIDGTNIFMLVEPSADSVSLSSKVICSEDSTWKLYYDKLGQVEIPTKIVAGQSGVLENGNNIFYIVVTSGDGTQVNTYQLTIHRSYAVDVRYYNDEEILKTESVYTGNKFTADYIPQIKGYTFNGWKTSDGEAFTEATVMGALSLYADKTAKSYEVMLDVNGGDELSKDTVTVTFDSNYSFPVPTREGYTFFGWYDEGTRLTDEDGESVYAWSYDLDMTVTAKWEANEYTVTLNRNDNEAGTVSGGGEHAYDSEVTITARTNDGYTWLGWYDENGGLVSDKTTYTFKMGLDISYTAKWSKVTILKNIDEAGTVTPLDGKYNVGDQVTVTAETNSGYTFIGWFDGNDTLLTSDADYTFAMPAENTIYHAKWSKVTILKNIDEAGTVTPLDGKYNVGDQVTVTAETNSGYTFIGWFDENDTLLTSDADYTFAMPAENISYTAKWTYYTLTTLRNDSVAGTITNYSNTKVTVGEKVTLTAETKSGYTFVGWFKDNIMLTNELNYVFTMPAENITYTAKWIKVTLINSNENAGSFEELSGKYKTGEQVIFKATENLGYIFDGWYEDGAKLSNALEYAYTMPSDEATIEARWQIKDEMNDFEFTSTTSECTIIAIKDKTKTEIVIPDYVTTIKKGSFENSLINTLKIPNSVTYIEAGAFKGCESLVEIEIPFVGCRLEHVGDSTAASYLNDYFGAIFGYIEVVSSAETPEGTTVQESDYTHGGSTFYKCCYYIPQSLKKVTILNNDVDRFTNCTMLTEVILGESVKYIGSEAFIGCSSLTSITIPDSVTSIGDSAFYNCSSLTNITIPDSVTSIGDSAFYNCSSLTNITIPDSMTIIERSVFKGCTSLTRVHISNSVISIENNAFSDCSSLTNITIPDSVTSIGSAAFSGCPIKTATVPTIAINYIAQENLKTVVITSGESIEDYAFNGCSALTSITIPDSVTSIGSSAFRSCSSLTSITIPDSVKSIGSSAFRSCSSLTSVSIGNGITSIANYAFQNCSLLTSITIPDSVKSIGSSAFSGCSSLTSVSIGNGVTSIANYAFQNCSSLTSITIPDSVTSIGDSVFDGCSSLTSVSIGNGVTSIGDNAFDGCSLLESITVEENNVAYANQDGILYNKAKTEFIHIPKAIKGTIAIPDSVKSIKASAFYGRTLLTNITIPDSVTSIGDKAFDGCSLLESITVEENNVAYASQDGILYNKAKTEFIHIPKAIKGTIVIPDSIASIGYRAFYGYTSLTNIIIPDSVTSIGKSAFSDCSSLTSVSIGNGVKDIEEEVFYNCSSLTSVSIGNVKSIGYSAFENCISLADINFSGTKTQWGMITKYAKWTDNTGNYTIHCTDGDISKN